MSFSEFLGNSAVRDSEHKFRKPYHRVYKSRFLGNTNGKVIGLCLWYKFPTHIAHYKKILSAEEL